MPDMYVQSRVQGFREEAGTSNRESVDTRRGVRFVSSSERRKRSSEGTRPRRAAEKSAAAVGKCTSRPPPPKSEFAPKLAFIRALDFKVSLGMRNSAALSSLR